MLFKNYAGIAGCARLAAKQAPRKETYRDDWPAVTIVQDRNHRLSGQLDKESGATSIDLQLSPACDFSGRLAPVMLQDFQTTLEGRTGTKVNC
jgi:hypothetical protein